MVKLNIFNPKPAIRFSAIVILLSVAEICWTTRTPVYAEDSGTAQPSESQVQWSEAEKNAYWQAIKDARTPEPSKLKPLTAISPDSPNQRWNYDLVLVVSWASNWKEYQDFQQQNSQQTPIRLDRDVWVTVVPELQSFCYNYKSKYGGDALGKRLIQRIGLSLGDAPGKREMVEFWVNLQFLFRPSFNPEITRHEVELQFPTSNPFLLLQPSYYQWFYSQLDQSYKYNGKLIIPGTKNDKKEQVWAYPWTQLGYTYDWGDPSNHVGLSEFVIHKGSPVFVKRVVETAKYCNEKPKEQGADDGKKGGA